MLYHAIENTVSNTINATYTQRMMGRLGVILWNIQLYYYSFPVHFLWHNNVSQYMGNLNTGILIECDKKEKLREISGADKVIRTDDYAMSYKIM